jgi:hypothetical protein
MLSLYTVFIYNIITALKIKRALSNNEITNIKKKRINGYTLYALIIKYIK